MVAPLDPFHLTPAASLNRARIVDLPGVALPTEVLGQTGYDLLSSATLIRDIQGRDPDLGLGAADLADPSDLPRRFDACFSASDPAIRAAAADLAHYWGRRLAGLVLMLRRGDAVNRAARSDWDASYWTHWARVQTVWLGGGLMQGHLGATMVQEATAFLAVAGPVDLALRRSAHPAVLPLIGAARSVPAGHPVALVFDFGGTAIKRALARYEGDNLAALRLLPAVPTALSTPAGPLALTEVRVLAQRMAALLAETWQDAAQGLVPAPVLVASMASYVADNHPLPAQSGVYMQVGAQVANLGAWLGEEAGRRLGRPLAVTLLHDGTAAARALAGEPQSAVIMLGTALGVGFPPPAAALRPLAPDLRIDPV